MEDFSKFADDIEKDINKKGLKFKRTSDFKNIIVSLLRKSNSGDPTIMESLETKKGGNTMSRAKDFNESFDETFADELNRIREDEEEDEKDKKDKEGEEEEDGKDKEGEEDEKEKKDKKDGEEEGEVTEGGGLANLGDKKAEPFKKEDGKKEAKKVKEDNEIEVTSKEIEPESAAKAELGDQNGEGGDIEEPETDFDSMLRLG